MSPRINPSGKAVEHIMEEGPRDGRDRKALRNFLAGTKGSGNTPFHLHTLKTVSRIRALLELPMTPGQRKLKELRERRERGELSPHDFDLNFLFRLNQINAPLTRKDLEHVTGMQAVVLDRRYMKRLGCVDFVHASGERMPIEAESIKEHDVLILYPEDLGDEI